MPPTQHSSFSASASQRLLNCPGSYSLALQADDGTRKSSIFAAEGTLAHAVSEACILTGLDPFSFVGQVRSADGYTFTITEEFCEAVSLYVGFVRTLKSLGYVVALEWRVSPQVHWDNMPELKVDMFGTADCVAYHPGSKTLVIGDLKFGAGIAVNAVGNTQLRYYASGAAHDAVLQALCDHSGVAYNGVDRVELNIIQPRAFHREGPLRRDVMTYDDLRTWARGTLYDGVQAALLDGGTTLSAGLHCRFCPVLAACQEPPKLALEVAQSVFANAPLENFPAPDAPSTDIPNVALSDAKVAELLDKIEIIEPWLNAVKQLALDRMEAGNKLPGYRLVPKRALRIWASEDAEVLSDLSAAGFHEADYSALKPLSPAQVERKVGKKAYDATVAGLVVKQSSGSKLAGEGDPRTRLSGRTAQEAFGITPTTTTHP